MPFDLEAVLAREEALMRGQEPSGGDDGSLHTALVEWSQDPARTRRITAVSEVERQLGLPPGVGLYEHVMLSYYEPRGPAGWSHRIQAMLLLNQRFEEGIAIGNLRQWQRLVDALDERGLLPPRRRYQPVGNPWFDVPGIDAQEATRQLVMLLRSYSGLVDAETEGMWAREILTGLRARGR